MQYCRDFMNWIKSPDRPRFAYATLLVVIGIYFYLIFSQGGIREKPHHVYAQQDPYIAEAVSTLIQNDRDNTYKTIGFLMLVLGWLLTQEKATIYIRKNPVVRVLLLTMMAGFTLQYAYIFSWYKFAMTDYADLNTRFQQAKESQEARAAKQLVGDLARTIKSMGYASDAPQSGQTFSTPVDPNSPAGPVIEIRLSPHGETITTDDSEIRRIEKLEAYLTDVERRIEQTHQVAPSGGYYGPIYDRIFHLFLFLVVFVAIAEVTSKKGTPQSPDETPTPAGAAIAKANGNPEPPANAGRHPDPLHPPAS